jgi:hypothetical protein
VTRQSFDRADDRALEVGLHQHRGEGVVDVAPLLVHHDPLHVAGGPGPAVEVDGYRWCRPRVSSGGGRGGGRQGREGTRRGESEELPTHETLPCSKAGILTLVARP